jgi:hypothetical protein
MTPKRAKKIQQMYDGDPFAMRCQIEGISRAPEECDRHYKTGSLWTTNYGFVYKLEKDGWKRVHENQQQNGKNPANP